MVNVAPGIAPFQVIVVFWPAFTSAVLIVKFTGTPAHTVVV